MYYVRAMPIILWAHRNWKSPIFYDLKFSRFSEKCVKNMKNGRFFQLLRVIMRSYIKTIYIYWINLLNLVYERVMNIILWTYRNWISPFFYNLKIFWFSGNASKIRKTPPLEYMAVLSDANKITRPLVANIPALSVAR